MAAWDKNERWPGSGVEILRAYRALQLAFDVVDELGG